MIALPVGEVPADRGELGFDVPLQTIELPVDRQRSRRPAGSRTGRGPVARLRRRTGLASLLAQVAADPDVASQRYADAQYDSTVQGNTVYGPQYGASPRSPPATGHVRRLTEARPPPSFP